MIDWSKPIETVPCGRNESPVKCEVMSGLDHEGDREVEIRGEWEDSDGQNEGGGTWFVRPDGTFLSLDGAVRNIDTIAKQPPMTTLFGLIRKWAGDRNLIEGATSQAQTVKLFEEGGEVAHAVARGDRDALKDGIGDMIVVLTILAAQNDLSVEECVAAAYDEIKDRTGRMVDGIYRKDEV